MIDVYLAGVVSLLYPFRFVFALAAIFTAIELITYHFPGRVVAQSKRLFVSPCRRLLLRDVHLNI
jgi:hypothetical protein